MSDHSAVPPHEKCQNCGADLRGRYCHVCGQQDFDFHRSFGHVFHEALENFLHFDAKFFRNIITLLFQPGRLSSDFNAGRRASQMPPFRLYLFVSVLFFFISFLGSGPRDFNLNARQSPEQRARVRQAFDSALEKVGREPGDPQARARIERAIRQLKDANEQPDAEVIALADIPKLIRDEVEKEEKEEPPPGVATAETGTAGPVAGDAEKKTVRTAGPDSPAFMVDGKDDTPLSRFFIERGKYAYEHQQEFVEHFIHALPKMLLFCVPFFALYTRVLFRKSGLVYLQDLVLSLHFHTFIFLWVMVRNGWGFLAGLASKGLANVLLFACGVWLVLYPLLMLRRIFGESWFKTILKSGVLAAAYLITLGLGFLATALILFLQL